jgi:hypothetical protein
VEEEWRMGRDSRDEVYPKRRWVDEVYEDTNAIVNVSTYVI